MKEGRLQHVKNTCQTKNKRGRPNKPVETRRGIRVSFRLTWTEYSRLRQLAQAEALTISEYLRRKILPRNGLAAPQPSCENPHKNPGMGEGSRRPRERDDEKWIKNCSNLY